MLQAKYRELNFPSVIITGGGDGKFQPKPFGHQLSLFLEVETFLLCFEELTSTEERST